MTDARLPDPPLAAADFHPLELLPWARRIERSPLRDVVYTLLFNTILAAVFTTFALPFTPSRSWASIAWANFVISNCIGYVIHLEFALAERILGDRHRRWGFWPRAAYFSLLPIAGVIAGYAIAFEIIDWQTARRGVFSAGGIASIVLLSLVISGILGTILAARERAAKSEAAVAVGRARVALAERSAALAQLKALEARVEPHFLYNTLAHVMALVDREPAVARAMLERLIVLLRASAAGAADGRSTLGEQLAHARAYLEIVGMRMGPRLSWSIDAPADLDARALPPAVLQPLVENAVKHGIEPAVDGGSITIRAREEGDRLLLAVEDSGAGFGSGREPVGGSTGVGLANLRARLDALYGDRARLTLADHPPRGVRASVRLPAGDPRD